MWVACPFFIKIERAEISALSVLYSDLEKWNYMSSNLISEKLSGSCDSSVDSWLLDSTLSTESVLFSWLVITSLPFLSKIKSHFTHPIF